MAVAAPLAVVMMSPKPPHAAVTVCLLVASMGLLLGAVVPGPTLLVLAVLPIHLQSVQVAARHQPQKLALLPNPHNQQVDAQVYLDHLLLKYKHKHKHPLQRFQGAILPVSDRIVRLMH